MKEAFLAHKELVKSWVSKHGAKKVYRGLSGKVAEEIKAQIKAGKKEIELTANSLSSWSESNDVAKNFGHSGVILSMNVDPEHVWACYQMEKEAFGSHPSEKEYVMGMPGQMFKIPAEQIQLTSYY